MKIEDLLTLCKAGFSAEQIATLTKEQKEPEPEPPKKKPEPEPPKKKPEPEPAKNPPDSSAELLKAISALTSKIETLNIQNAHMQEQEQSVPSPVGSSEEQVSETSETDVHPAAEQSVTPSANIKPMKSTKTVKLILPMEYYFKLVQIKACTDKSLQDLAAQAVMDFVDNFGKE